MKAQEKNRIFAINEIALGRPRPMLENSICIMPYIGRGTQGHLSSLQKAVKSAKKYFDQIIVTVADQGDFDVVRCGEADISAMLIKNVIRPDLLPSFSLMVLQDWVRNNPQKASFVFYSEANLAIHFEKINADCALLNDKTHIRPVQIDRSLNYMGPADGLHSEVCDDFSSNASKGLTFAGRDLEQEVSTGYCRAEAPARGCGSAWLCGRSLFTKAPFKMILRNEPEKSPLYALMLISDALRPRRWEQCYAEHLGRQEDRRMDA